jgi:hypothetical protein
MPLRTRHILQKTVAGLMAAWLSGFVFLFCCGDTAKAAEMGEFCPMAKPAQHHCDTATQQNEDADTVSRAKGVCIDCCAFLPVVFDKARKVDQPQQPLVAPERVAMVARQVTPRLHRRTGVIDDYRARLPDKSRTFISTQVFRI